MLYFFVLLLIQKQPSKRGACFQNHIPEILEKSHVALTLNYNFNYFIPIYSFLFIYLYFLLIYLNTTPYYPLIIYILSLFISIHPHPFFITFFYIITYQFPLFEFSQIIFINLLQSYCYYFYNLLSFFIILYLKPIQSLILSQFYLLF